MEKKLHLLFSSTIFALTFALPQVHLSQAMEDNQLTVQAEQEIVSQSTWNSVIKQTRQEIDSFPADPQTANKDSAIVHSHRIQSMIRSEPMAIHQLREKDKIWSSTHKPLIKHLEAIDNQNEAHNSYLALEGSSWMRDAEPEGGEAEQISITERVIRGAYAQLPELMKADLQHKLDNYLTIWGESYGK